MPEREETPQEFLARMRSIGYLQGGRTQDRVKEYRHPDKGYRMKETTDELNNTVTQHAVGDRQDVMIRPKTVRVTKEDMGL
jgi:hypothetical protein